MIERMLIDSGCKCGTKKNLSTQISTDLKNGSGQHWYFLTPLKIKESTNGVMSTVINMGFPFIAKKDEQSEEDVLKRIDSVSNEYKNGLKKFFSKWCIKCEIEFSNTPFYGGGSGERSELTNFGNNKIHLLNVIAKIDYRESKINCNCK